MTPKTAARWFGLLALVGLAGCTAPPGEIGISYQPRQFNDLPGWATADPRGALTALAIGCRDNRRVTRAARLSPAKLPGSYAAWRRACAAVAKVADNAAAARAFFERYFRPYQLAENGRPDGLFTGYFEPQIDIRDKPDATYRAALYARPDDLIMANLGRWQADWAGGRIAGRVVDGYLRPYHDRRAIRAGALAGKAKVLAWADPVDAFFLQIQGSGIARLPNGGTWRLAYDGHNGHRYVAIGRELIAEGAIARADMSMQAIEKWLRANPERAAEMMARNPSFIFFRRRQGPGPIGAAGVPLTAGRSLAIDTRYVPFEAPVWLDLPELRRLMVAQDRGGAIKGAVRGDVFWGSGPRAATRAGAMAARGAAYVLLPKAIAPNP